MAYVDQDKKAKIAAALKACMPKGWKYSLAVRHHSTIVLTIYASPIDLANHFDWSGRMGRDYGDEGFQVPAYLDLNPYHWRDHMKPAPAELLATIEEVFAALNIENFDKSDITTDYFHVGHYVDVNIGKWNKPHQLIAAALH